MTDAEIREYNIPRLIMSLVLVLFFFFVSFSLTSYYYSFQYTEREKGETNWYRCYDTVVKTEQKEYDLMVEYNLTCKAIEFIIKTWSREIHRERDYSSEGVLPILTGYHYEDVYYGVGDIKLDKYVSKFNYSKECGGGLARTEIGIYLESDFKEYYLKRCLHD